MSTNPKVDTRHLRGFRKIQSEILKAIKEGVPPKEYRPLAVAYREAVSGERMVLGLDGTNSGGGTAWPEEMVVRWVDDDEADGPDAAAREGADVGE